MTVKEAFLPDGSDWHESGVYWDDVESDDFDVLCTRIEEVPQRELDKLKKEGWEYDIRILQHGGRDWIIEPLREHQPKSFAVLQEHAGNYFLGFRWFDRFQFDPPQKDEMNVIGYLEVNGRLIHVDAGNRIFEEGVPKYWQSSYNALPEAIAKSWLWRTGGWAIHASIVGSPMLNRQLIGGNSSGWAYLEKVLNSFKRNSYKKNLPIILEQIPDAVVTQYNPHDGKPYTWQSFRCFLDTRPEGLNGPCGDQLLVVDVHDDKTVYHIHDGDIKNIRILHNPAEAVDAYCAHTLLRTPGRFDFMPWSEPLK